MTTQYNVAVKVIEPEKQKLIPHSLKGYDIFTDQYGNLDKTAFSKEYVPYIGEVIVIKTLKEDAARRAHSVLHGIEGLAVLPITESILEEDRLTSNVLQSFKK